MAYAFLVQPNAALQAPPIAGAERRLSAVACKRWLGAPIGTDPSGLLASHRPKTVGFGEISALDPSNSKA
jgi:hypothetical protein